MSEALKKTMFEAVEMSHKNKDETFFVVKRINEEEESKELTYSVKSQSQLLPYDATCGMFRNGIQQDK